MDLDISYIEPLLDEWLEELQLIIKAQEKLTKSTDEFYMPYIAVPIPIVNAIYKITEYLHLERDIRYITIHLYDKFMCNYFWEMYKKTDGTQSSWSQICKSISSQSILYLMSCLQLAYKMNSHLNNLKIPQVLGILQRIDKKSVYTRKIIVSSEFKVFKTIGFRMPLCTPLNCIEILLAATGLKDTPRMQELTIDLLDLFYLQRKKLYSHLQCLIQGYIARTIEEKRSLMALESNVLFLGASVILCGTFFLYVKSETVDVIAMKLSQLIDIKVNNIWDMANILLTMAIQE